MIKTRESISEKIHTLAVKYSENLKAVIDARIIEMKDDDNSHYLLYRVLGITDAEGKMIDEYQNKGRFLYRYAGSFLEEAALLCFEEKFSDIKKKIKNTKYLGSPPKNFRDRLSGGWRST